MRIGIIGSGISGLVTAYLLQDEHDLTVFEANDYIGGHTHTVDVKREDGRYAVNTGFIVFNELNYPNFVKLMRKLQVVWQDSDMSFSVQCARTGLEYSPSSLDKIFAQRSNLLRLRFLKMIREIFRFRKEAAEVLQGEDYTTLGEYLRKHRYSREFEEYFIIPMGAAIWSADPEEFRKIPVRFFVQFFTNHAFLEVRGQPQWLTIRGGSNQYIPKLTKGFQDRIRLNCPIRTIRRLADGIEVCADKGAPEIFDQVVIAAHSDQALKMLTDASESEREILGALPYQQNSTILHTDRSLLPNREKVWASWNYFISAEIQNRVSVTYNMNILQNISSAEVFCVTLNRSQDIDKDKIIRNLTYAHPVFTPAGIAAQKRHAEISGVNHTHFCGAYWGYGFHEDGVNSALEVAKYFGKSL